MSGGGASSREASRAREEEAARELRVKQGTENIRRQFGEAFNNTYYDKFETEGKKQYLPIVQQQYQKSLDTLNAALVRNGLGKSTIGNKLNADVDAENVRAQDQVTNQLRNMMNQRKTDVANQESVAVGQLQSSADPASASRQAAHLIDNQTALPGWSPMGQVFTDASAFLANQSDAERSGNARYNLGVSKWGDNARRYLSNVGS